MQWDEASARRVILVEALETADLQGRLFSAEDRAQADRFAREGQAIAVHDAAVGHSGGHAARMVLRRAQMVLRTLAVRHPDIAALQQGRDWTGRVTLLLAALTLALGFVTDRVANPHRVDLLSLPLLAILAWNLMVYVVLLAGALWPARPATGEGLVATMLRWLDGGWRWRRGPSLGLGKGLGRAEVSARFYALWHAATATLNGQRLRRVLHIAAAAWAAGIAASLFARGLVVEYRVGWESTFLDATQVHAILSVLFAPLVALFSLAPFTVSDVAQLRFDQGAAPEAGARWVYLYATLLALVVLLPRGLLALLAWRGERQAARHLGIDLATPYFQDVLDNLLPVRVRLGVLAADGAGLQVLRRIFLQHAPPPLPLPDARGHLPVCAMLRGADGDECEWQELAPDALPGGDPGTGMVAWARRTWQGVRGGVDGVQAAATPQPDVVLLVVASAVALQAAMPATAAMGKPMVVLLRPDGPGASASHGAELTACRAALRAADCKGTVLAWDAVARCWVQETELLAALAAMLPPGKARGFGRLAQCWQAAQQQRFLQAMALLARSLCGAARLQETAQATPLSARHVVDAGERQTYADEKQAAMHMVMTQLEQDTAQTTTALLRLHGAQAGGAGWAGQALPDKFVVHHAVNASQAGLAGAASGAAMGVSLDLLVGGLSLGAGAALGALVGGGAAWVGAAWKNRSAPSGATTVQLSDPMLRALLEAHLLRYLSVIHLGRLQPAVAAGEVLPEWTAAVMHTVEGADDQLAPTWAAARRLAASGPDADMADVVEPLAAMLAELTQAVLHHLYPDTALDENPHAFRAPARPGAAPLRGSRPGGG